MRVFAMSVGKFFMRRFIFGVFTLPVPLLIFYRSRMTGVKPGELIIFLTPKNNNRRQANLG